MFHYDAVTRDDIPHFIDGTIGREWTLYLIPTAEQMIGWLEEQGISIVIRRFFAKWAFKLEQLTSVGEKNLHVDSIEISSHKEATLAAIDAALDYLIKNK